jgi:hypothetical protein
LKPEFVIEASKFGAEWSAHLRVSELPGSRSHSADYEEYCLLGCNAVEFGACPAIRKKYRLHHQGRKVSQTRKSISRRQGFTSPSVVFSLALVVDPESGDDMFLRNVGLTPNCTVLQAKGKCSRSHIDTLTPKLTMSEVLPHRLINIFMSYDVFPCFLQLLKSDIFSS